MYYIYSNVYEEIIKTIGNAPIESGGIIGIKNNIICKFYFDKSESRHNTMYIPNTKVLNYIIDKWADSNIDFAGIVHSHPNSCTTPSLEDYYYATNLKQLNPTLKKILFPIVTIENKIVNITFYEFDNNFSPESFKIIDNKL